MRRWFDRLAIVLGLLIVAVAIREGLRPTPPPRFTITPSWKVGETRHYLVTTELSKSQDGLTRRSSGSKVSVDLTVLEVTEAGSVISWRLGKTREFDPFSNTIPMIAELQDALADLEIELLLDAHGAIRGVRNWREIQQRLRASIPIVEKSNHFQDLTDEGKRDERAHLESTMDSESDVVYQVTDVPRLFFAAEGLQLRDEQTTSCTRDLGNPIAAMSLPWQMGFSLQSDERGEGHAVVHFTGTVRSRDLANVMDATLAQNPWTLKGSKRGAESIRSCTLSIEGTMRINPQSGWVDTLAAEKTIQQTDMVEVVTYSITPHGADGQRAGAGQ